MSEALTVEFADFGEDDPQGKVCACGCGEPMPPHSKRAYLYGHKKDAEEREVNDDPEPSDEAKQKSVVRVTKAVRENMRETLEAYLLLASGAWEMSDPVCGSVASEQASKIAERLVPVLARNQAFVRYFGRTNSFREGMDLIMALWPVLKIAGQHHIFHTVGVVERGEQPVQLNGYVA